MLKAMSLKCSVLYDKNFLFRLDSEESFINESYGTNKPSCVFHVKLQKCYCTAKAYSVISVLFLL